MPSSENSAHQSQNRKKEFVPFGGLFGKKTSTEIPPDEDEHEDGIHLVCPPSAESFTLRD